jgi:hypothetical protein
MYARKWHLYFGHFDREVKTGHEAEATENFARYFYDQRKEPRRVGFVSDPAQLPPTVRLSAMHRQVQARWKVMDGDRSMDKLKLAVSTLEAFVDVLRTTQYDRSMKEKAQASVRAAQEPLQIPAEMWGREGAAVEEPAWAHVPRAASSNSKSSMRAPLLSSARRGPTGSSSGAGPSPATGIGADHPRRRHKIDFEALEGHERYHFQDLLHAAVQIGMRTYHDHPDALAGLLRCAQLAGEVGDREERDDIIKQTRRLVNKMEAGYAFARPNDPTTTGPATPPSAMYLVRRFEREINKTQVFPTRDLKDDFRSGVLQLPLNE